ncbi:hypothetical protein [Variovorax sp. LjRoot178]|uniref:hypothetical protein n=1 Tax=Variovorax sp. LjRoot178 TaxID=3342277 RepID=UPI003ED11BB9
MTDQTLAIERVRLIDRGNWGQFLTPVVQYIERVAAAVMQRPVQVNICRNWKVRGHVIYGPDAGLTFNYSRLQPHWFVGPVENINELVLLGLAHEYSPDSSSVAYREGLARLAARMLACAIASPATFELNRPNAMLRLEFLPSPDPDQARVPTWVLEGRARREFVGPLRPSTALSDERPKGGLWSTALPEPSGSESRDDDGFLFMDWSASPSEPVESRS